MTDYFCSQRYTFIPFLPTFLETFCKTCISFLKKREIYYNYFFRPKRHYILHVQKNQLKLLCRTGFYKFASWKTTQISTYKNHCPNEKKERRDALAILFEEALRYEPNKTSLVRVLNKEFFLGEKTLREMSNGVSFPVRKSVREGFFRGLLQYLDAKRWEHISLSEVEVARRIEQTIYRATMRFFDIDHAGEEW